MGIAPPVVAASAVSAAVEGRGFAVVDAANFGEAVGVTAAELDALVPSWSSLPRDNWLKDGGHYRSRRHSCFVVDGAAVAPVAHRAHWQSVDYNALHGGFERWFEPVSDDVASSAAFASVLRGVAAIASSIKGARPWFVEAHQFRIDTHEGIGRPTPEGAHRDGVDVVVVIFVGRAGIKGGETRVFDANGTDGVRFTLTEPWSALVLDDARVIHESTPIVPLGDGNDGHRDTLVLTLRRDGFQSATQRG